MNNYFSHDSNARDDEKILAMRIDLGWEAYGLYWALIEMLRDASDYKLKANFKVLAFSLHTTPELIEQIICNYGLFSFTEDGDSFFSHSLTKRMEEKEVISKKRRSSADKRWKTDDVSDSKDADVMQMQCKCNANASDLHCNTDAIASPNKSKVKENKVNNNTSPRTREGASAPSEEEKDEFYKIFFWRNLKNPTQELQRFLSHNTQYGWKLNNTPEKRREAALNWAPESNGDRVSKNFLAAWREIYKKLIGLEPAVAALMLTDDTKVSACNGALVLHAAPIVIDHIKEHRPPELTKLANGNPVRFSSIG